MSANDNSIQAQLKKDEADVLASFQLANEHLNIGDTHPNDGKAGKMQKVSVTVHEILNVLESAGFYGETVALAIAKLRSETSTGNTEPSWLFAARNEKRKEAADNRAESHQHHHQAKKSRFKPEFLGPAASMLS